MEIPAVTTNDNLAALTSSTRRWHSFSVIAALTILLVCVIWLVAYERVRFEHDQAVSAEAAKNDDLALAHEERSIRSLEVFDNALRTVRYLHLHGGVPRDLRAQLGASGLDARYYTVFSVIGADGEVLASNAPEMKQNFADRGYFQEHARNAEDQLRVGAPILGRLTRRWVVSLTRRIEGPAGEFAGVMFVALDPAFLATEHESTSQGPNGVTSLVGLDGIVRARRKGNVSTFGDDASNSVLFKEIGESRVGHYVAQASVDGMVRAVSYRRMVDYPLIAVVSTPLNDVLARARDRDLAIFGSAAAGTLLTCALGLSTALMLRRSMRAMDEAEASNRVYAQLNHALNESELRANRVIDSAPSAMMVVEADGAISRVNKHAEALFGYGCGDMMGMPVDQLVPQAARHKHAEYRDEFRLNGSTRAMGHGMELYACRKDGSLLAVEIGLAPLVSGQPGQSIVSVVDITQRKAMQAELTQHRDRLEEQVAARTVELVNARNDAERHAQAKTQFLANMSHEIRTPLNAVTGMAYLIRRQGLSDKQARQMDTLERSSAHLLSVINSILELSKIDARALYVANEQVAVATLVREVIDMQLQGARDKQVDLVVDLAPLPDGLLGDVTRLRQALLNYVSNAIKFTHAGSMTVRVSVAAQDDDAALLRFEVQDTGVGISTHDLPRLFRAFEQADNSPTRRYGGTGLGLAITRMVARQMGGDAGAFSQVGEGSTFWFTARLKKDATAKTADQAENTCTSLDALIERYAGTAVLLVDDEPVNLEVAAVILEEAGLNVWTATGGVEALDTLTRQRVDLVVLDVQMPEMDGLTVARRIRTTSGLAKLPIIAMTANAFAEHEAECLLAGMTAFIAKPVEPERLYKALLSCLDGSAAGRR